MRDERQQLERALSLQNNGDTAAAARLYRRIIAGNPDNAPAVHLLGVAEAATGNVDRAKSLMARSLQLDPANLQFVENYASILHRAGDHEDALALCQRGLRLSANSLVLLHVSAAALLGKGRYQEALAQLSRLLAHHPKHFPAHFMAGSALAKAGQYDAALAAHERALALNPQLVEAHLDRGTIYSAKRDYGKALAAYDNALSLRPGFAEAWLARGYTLIQLGRHQEALTAVDNALTLQSAAPAAWAARGNALLELGRFPEAAAAFDRALAIDQRFAPAWSGHGNVLLRTGRNGEASAAFDRAIDADPAFSEAWLGRGILLISLCSYEDAIAALDRALALNATLAGAWVARGQAAYFAKRYAQALTDWKRALELTPDQPALDAACLRAAMHNCDWRDFDAVSASVRTTGRVISPFMLVAIPSTAVEQLQCARLWIRSNFASVHGPVWRGERYDHDRIRVAFLSADFHQHATAYLIAGMIEHHDRSRFEVTGISLGPDDNSDMRRRLEAGLERFVDARSLTDDEIADLVKTLEIDILVDLKGFTHDARTRIFALRPAPIQVNYLGFPGTLGADFIDYIIADRTVIPARQRDSYAEKVVWLPHSYQANDRLRAIADANPTRSGHGLPESAFVFCCMNDNYKITPDVFSLWMRILAAVEESVLWLYEDNPTAADNLRREAAARGIAPQRLVFARRIPAAEHLARYRCADLFLDTLPYGAHTTASDALWAGLPVLTGIGETFAGRVGASLLNAIGLPELIATSPDAYEALAIALARDPARLASIRAKLAGNRLTTPLFDTAAFTADIELAYASMVERHRGGLPPDHIELTRGAPR